MQVLASCMVLSCMLISFRAWVLPGFLGRTVPTLPIMNGIPVGVQIGLSFLLLVVLLSDLIWTWNGKTTLEGYSKTVALLLILVLVTQDLIRIQPWLFMGALIWLCRLLNKETAAQGQALRMILSSMYLWAGVHKMHQYFIHLVVYPIVQTYHLPAFFSFMGYLISLTDVTIALLLMFRKTRNIGGFMAILMHAFILLHYGLVMRYNLVIVPWNLACMGMVWLSCHIPEGRSGSMGHWNLSHGLLLIIAGILPLFQRVGYPAYLSWSLYADRAIPVILIANKDVPPMLTSSILKTEQGESILNLNHWLMSNLGVPVSPEDGLFIDCLGQSLGRFVPIVRPKREMEEKYPEYRFIWKSGP